MRKVNLSSQCCYSRDVIYYCFLNTTNSVYFCLSFPKYVNFVLLIRYVGRAFVTSGMAYFRFNLLMEAFLSDAVQ